jgi:2-methylcitrate dehydratase PrpD
MIARIHFGVNEVAEKAGYDKMTTLLDLHLRDGRTLSARADFAKGSPANPMSWTEVVAKFEDCARFARWPAEKARSIVDSVAHLQDLRTVAELTHFC